MQRHTHLLGGGALRSPHTPRRRRAGFTVIEIMVATLIFFLIVTFAQWSMAQSYDQALDSEGARALRMLAERKLAEIAVFERHHDENLGPERFDDLPDDIREQFQDWEWQLDVRDVTVFGVQKDENAPYLFEPPGTEGTEGKEPAGAGAESAQKKGETQILRELVLKVTQRDQSGEPGASIELVTFLPQVAAKAGKAAGEAPK